MIEIRRFEGGITVEGHAGYANHGEDIVCAAISTLAQTLIASFEALTEEPIRYDIQPGWVDIRHRKKPSKQGSILIDAFFVGAELIAEEYPQNVQIVQALIDDKSYGENGAGVERHIKATEFKRKNQNSERKNQNEKNL